MTSYKMRGLLLLVALYFLTGCGAYQMKKIRDQNYPTWPKHMQEAVDRSEVIIGMNEIQVQIATGVGANLIRKSVYVSEYGVRETWCLWRSFGGWYFANPGIGTMVLIHFENGFVKGISYH